MESSTPRDPLKRTPRTSQEWIRCYEDNAVNQREIPWHLGAEISDEELRSILRSLQAWQLGESSDGAHLLKAAAHYATKVGDSNVVRAADLFKKEEQRHGEMLGRFIELAGQRRIRKDWGDSLFRKARYSITSMEVWATPVIMVETIALLYYKAIHDATQSSVLRAICKQILHDEVPHIRFQYERIAILHRERSRLNRFLTHAGQRIFFTMICLLVWYGHSSAFRAGGVSFRSFWKEAWRKMRSSWKRMNPDLYHWEQFDSHLHRERTAHLDVVEVAS